MGRENIKATEIFLDGQILDANILGYRYLGDSLAIGYGNWTQLDKTTNSMVRGQWGNIFIWFSIGFALSQFQNIDNNIKN